MFHVTQLFERKFSYNSESFVGNGWRLQIRADLYRATYWEAKPWLYASSC